jgi:hypothetical protein
VFDVMEADKASKPEGAIVRYYSKLRWLEHIPFDQYHSSGDMPLLDGNYSE